MKRCNFSRRRNVDDSADVTSSGRSFQICGPTTGKARLPTVDSLTGGTTRRLVSLKRAERSVVRQVGDAGEGSKVLRCLFTQNVVFSRPTGLQQYLNWMPSRAHSQWRETTWSDRWRWYFSRAGNRSAILLLGGLGPSFPFTCRTITEKIWIANISGIM